jgi:hypothetical protein
MAPSLVVAVRSQRPTPRPFGFGGLIWVSEARVRTHNALICYRTHILTRMTRAAPEKIAEIDEVDRRKRLSHVGAHRFAFLWGRRFRLPTDCFTASESEGAEFLEYATVFLIYVLR